MRTGIRCPEGKQCAFQHDRQKFPPSAAAKKKAKEARAAAKALAATQAQPSGAAPSAVAAEEQLTIEPEA